jgi:uncharacterized membrane protein YvlD (DUF360 family)
MRTQWGLLLAIIIVGVTSGFVIWIVSKLGLGLEVDGFGRAFITAIVIAVVAILLPSCSVKRATSLAMV